MKNSPTAKKKPWRPFEYFVYDFAKVTAGIPALIAYRPKIHYENENARARIRGGALVIANHTQFLDPVILMSAIWYRRHRFICLNEIMERPFLGWLFRQFHCIPVNRENFGMETLRDIVEQLKDDRLISMFPEGHMVVDGGPLDAFKSGMVLMSVMSRKPIIPVYIAPRAHWYQRVHVVIGEPVDVVGTYGPMPALPVIEEITKDFHQREERLKQIYLESRKTK